MSIFQHRVDIDIGLTAIYKNMNKSVYREKKITLTKVIKVCVIQF